MSYLPQGWEIYTVTYRPIHPFFIEPPKGSPPIPDDKKYGQEMHMMVCTKGGRKDAEAACKQRYKSCKIVGVQSRLEVLAEVKLPAEKAPTKVTKKKLPKKGSKK